MSNEKRMSIEQLRELIEGSSLSTIEVNRIIREFSEPDHN